MYMAPIRVIGAILTIYTTRNIMIPFAMGAMLPVRDWVTAA